MSSVDVTGLKKRTWLALSALAASGPGALATATETLFDRNVRCHVSHPMNDLDGTGQLLEHFLRPMKRALPDLQRRDDIFLCSPLADEPSSGGSWVAATGYYYGTFLADWLGIPATRGWLAVRYGEFYRLDGERIVEMYCLLDLIDVMRQAGVRALPPSLGVESLVPGPATHDGCTFTPADSQESLHTSRLVDAMLFEGLMQFDGKSSASIGMERYWDRGMMWFGPGGIGTTHGLDGFLKYHQEPFQNAFPDWKGAIPFAIAEGRYMAAGGWPSIQCSHTGIAWLGQQPSGIALTMRVMDWWRREGDWLMENWIFIDIPHVFLQLGIDLLQGAAR